MSTEATVNSIIEKVRNDSDTLISDARSYADSAVNAASTSLGFYGYPTINPKIVDYDPSQFTPIQDLRVDFNNKYEEIFNKLTPLAKKEFNEIMAKLFPSDEVWNELGNYLNDSIKNGDIGLPEHIENQIWQRLRDRENIQLKTALDTAYNDASSRGFSIPPGFIAGASVSLQNNVNKNLSAQNRDIAIRIAELKIEWAKFAIQNIIDMKKVALQNALEFMNNIYKSVQSAQGVASGNVSSYQSFYNSMSAYVAAISNINELNLRIDTVKADSFAKMASINSNLSIEENRTRVNTALELARSMGVLAGSVTSGINTLAQVGFQEQVNG